MADYYLNVPKDFENNLSRHLNFMGLGSKGSVHCFIFNLDKTKTRYLT